MLCACGDSGDETKEERCEKAISNAENILTEAGFTSDSDKDESEMIADCVKDMTDDQINCYIDADNADELLCCPGVGDGDGLFKEDSSEITLDNSISDHVNKNRFDTYIFEPELSGDYTIFLTELNGDCDLLLYSVSLDLLDSSENSGQESEQITCAMTANKKYEIDVENWDDMTVSYTIIITKD
ncbi:MAG: hypothetical protein JXK07_11160 [Spirochaetes bacterium]|nr:hypothetical protein [Spirochaetota bacterium]MBN2772409.1 hypothetical protein [Spirochaetota bacterium]